MKFEFPLKIDALNPTKSEIIFSEIGLYVCVISIYMYVMKVNKLSEKPELN